MRKKSRQSKRGRRIWLILGSIGGIGAALSISVWIIAVAATPTANPVLTTTPSPLPVFTPTATPMPEPIPSITATHGPPILGGPLSNFIGKYGRPNDHSEPPTEYHFLRAARGNLDGLVVTLETGTLQVDDIVVVATALTNAVGWTLSQAESRCLAFAPTDAHFKRRIVYTESSGFDLVYMSVSLAHLLPANDFTNEDGGAVPVGSFDISYLHTSDGQHIRGCELEVGVQQIEG